MSQADNEPPKVRGPPPGETAPPEHAEQPRAYEIFSGPRPDGHAGEGTEEQKKPPQPTITEGINSIKSDDFFNVHKIPCARQGFMTGIASGAATGMTRYIMGAAIPKAANWAFGVFFISSIMQWEYCRAQRTNERAAMARVVEVMEKKKAEKAAEAARLKQEAEEKARQEAIAKKSWYKFW